MSAIGREAFEVLEYEPGSPHQLRPGQVALRRVVVESIDQDRALLRLDGGSAIVASLREPRRKYIPAAVHAVAAKAAAQVNQQDGSASVAEARDALRTLAMPLAAIVDRPVPTMGASVDNREELLLAAAIAAGEGDRLEFKRDLLWAMQVRAPDIAKDEGERVASMEIAGFANADGGTILYGVEDDGTVIGLADDLLRLSKPDNPGTMDAWQLRLRAKVASYLGGGTNTLIAVRWLKSGPDPVAAVDVARAAEPVYFRNGDQVDLIVRAGNQIRRLKVDDAVAYAVRRFNSPG